MKDTHTHTQPFLVQNVLTGFSIVFGWYLQWLGTIPRWPWSIWLWLQSISLSAPVPLCHLMTAAFPPHFTRDSRVTHRTSTSRVWPGPSHQRFIWLSTVALQTRKSQWWCLLVNTKWEDVTLKHWGLKGRPRVSVWLDELLKVGLGPSSLEGLIYLSSSFWNGNLICPVVNVLEDL